MGDKTAIEWTDATWNPVRARNRETGAIGFHCEHASPGCINCYAEKINLRLGTKLPFTRQSRELVEIFLERHLLEAPFHWRRPRNIFLTSMSDAAAEFVTDEMLDRMLAVAALCPRHTIQLLTKRADRLREYLSAPGRQHAIANAAMEVTDDAYDCVAIDRSPWPLPNLWIGTSVEDRRNKGRIDELRETPAALRFLSLEPLLEDLGEIDLRGVGWVITGGESGRGARPPHPDWVRAIRDQCAAAGVPFVMKQWGEWSPNGGSNTMRFMKPDGSCGGFFEEGFTPLYKAGKRRSGRLLDGREHSAFPELAHG